MSNKIGNRIVMGVLISSFVLYNCIIYTEDAATSNVVIMSDTALHGEQIWQKNNCTACHQLYGLGGYLGPDLTNIISNPTKGEEYAKLFFNSGVKSMPKFSFTEKEKEALVCFLEHVDRTGIYPNKNAQFDYSGWVTVEYK